MSQNIRNLLALAGYDMAGDEDDLSGYDMAGDEGDDLGWNPFGRKKKKQPKPLTPAQQRLGQWLQRARRAVDNPGLPAARGGVERREQDVGGDITFTFTPASAQTVDITCDPWQVMTPAKLIVESATVGSPGCLVQLKSVQIGPTNMLGNGKPIGIGRYAPLAPGNRVQWSDITPRIGAILTFITTAPPATNTSITIEVSLGCVSAG